MHLQIDTARFENKVRITIRTAVYESVTKYLVSHHLFAPAKDLREHAVIYYLLVVRFLFISQKIYSLFPFKIVDNKLYKDSEN